MSFLTASALLRGNWLIDKKWTKDNLPLVLKILKGEAVDFGYKRNELTQPLALSNKAIAAYSVGYYTDLSQIPDGSIAILTIAGPILKYGDMCSYGSVDYAATVNRLANAGNISGIIINIDSPGGQASGTATLADAIKSAASIKPVIGLVDDGLACSAGYWILSACTEIYVTQKTDWVGSIGVYTTIMDVYGYFESQGLKVRDVYAPQSDDKNLDYRSAIEGDDTLLKDELSVLCQQFIDTVSENRAGKLTSDDWQSGKVYYAKDAERIGLIDGRKNVNQVMNRMTRLINVNNNSNTNTNTKMKFSEKYPSLATALNIAADANIADVTVDSFLPGCESLETALVNNKTFDAEKTAFNTTIEGLQANVETLQTSNNTLTETNVSLTEKNTGLEAENTSLKAQVKEFSKDGADATTDAAGEDPKPITTTIDPLNFAFENEIRSRL